MNLKKEDFPDSAPGSKHAYQGAEYVAVVELEGCDGCAFYDDDNINSDPEGCDASPRGCVQNKTVWMTPADAITRRLTA